MVKMYFKYKESNPFSGAISFLHKRYLKNYEKIVNITANYWSDSMKASYVVDFTDEYWYAKLVDGGSFVIIHFPFHSMKLEGYLVQTSYYKTGVGSHPKGWFASVSSDNVTFLNEEKYTDKDEHMNSPYAFQYVPYSPNGIFDYFKIKINESSYHGDGSDINHIELFGTLYSNQYPKCSMKKSHNLSSLYAIILVILVS